MSSTRWKKLHAAIACTFVLGTGCANLAERKQEAYAAMLGTEERRLLSRLGPPDHFHFGEERRYFLYRLDLRRRGGFPEPSGIKPTFCSLLFRIDSGVVAAVQVRGVNHAGLNADTRCTILAGEVLGAPGRNRREVSREAFTKTRASRTR